MNISSRYHTYSIKFEKSCDLQVHFKFGFGQDSISFNMKSFFLKIFKINQTEVAPKMKIFLHNVPCTKEHDINFEMNTTYKYTFLSQT